MFREATRQKRDFYGLSSKSRVNFFMADGAFGMRGTAVMIFNIGNIQICNMAIETNPVDGLVAFIFFVLLVFFQLRYPDNPTPYHLHPNTIWLSILSFLLYCFFIFSGNLYFGIRVNHFQTLKHVFGSLSLLCLLVLMLPDTWECFTFLIYISWFIIHVLSLSKTHFMETKYEEGGASTVTNHFNGF
ncbi:hypothetical protein PHAVU_010G106700 [Phaseolus vulgaris]|uniref:Uncharacterized protein n=1 Tax=Phaseolus vulgaris TaxID=3885 RepID=V7ANL5_PHAVU|nr:hypothetical protein PHAVU_010G106700g [Phaseolus vulgaris]ESW07159.1 hypothetical protein PHAVU_010G106700g [Phaseolus vulgaris]